MSQTPNTNAERDLHDDCPWLKARVEGNEGPLWRRAQTIFLLSKIYSKELPWFKLTNDIQLRVESKYFKTNSNRRCHDSPDSLIDSQEIGSAKKSGHKFYIKSSIRKLIDLIITRWNTKYLRQKVSKEQLHISLIPSSLTKLSDVVSSLQVRNDDNNTKIDLKPFYSCLTTLHYHEVWAAIVQDHLREEISIDDRKFQINVEAIEPQTTGCERKETALLVGIVNMISNDSVTRITKKLGLFDVILITIDDKQYFGVIVCVKLLEVQNANAESREQMTLVELNKPIKIKLSTIIGIYVSEECSEAVKNQQQTHNSTILNVLKLSNITSSVRMISAIENLRCWKYERNLIIPKSEDPYFHLPSGFDALESVQRHDFNSNQSKAIDISAYMHDDNIDRLHLVCGPPGTGKSHTIAGIVSNLLSNHLYKGAKILVCAPSNTACDVISGHILKRLTREQIDQHTLIRIGSQPPNDDDLSNNFLNFLVLQEIVNILRKNPKVEKVDLTKIQNKILSQTQIIVSTLNNCASSRLSSLVDKVSFVIIDEASQSLMADCLIPNRFNCARTILVGDSKQLQPTVLSKAGQEYGLNESLYEHLYQTLEKHNGITNLAMQYRMHSEICSFPNGIFYKFLETNSSVNERMRGLDLRRIYYYNRSVPGAMKEDSSSIKNTGEAEFVVQLCLLLIDHLGSQTSDTQKKIGIISPYQAHKHFLQSRLPPQVEVMTADAAQGKEKDFIILSCVRSGEEIGFLNDTRRLNVALTRAREALYIVGNLRQIAQKNDTWNRLVTDAEKREIIFDVRENDQPILPRCESKNV